jgi:drug/metabolite transporter (DMT)-like permease
VTLVSSPARQRTEVELGLAAGSVAVMLWGLGPLLVKGSGLTTPTIVGIRYFIAAPVLYAIAYWRGAKVTRAVYRAAFVPGLLFGASIITGFAAVRNTSVTNATLIGNMMPVVVLLWARLAMHHEVPNRQFLAVVAAVVGVVTVVIGAGSSGDAAIKGDVIAFTNLFVWSAYFLRTKRLRDQGQNVWAMLAAISTICMVLISPFCLLVANDLDQVDLKGVVFIGAIVLGPGVIGHGLMTWSSKHLDVTISSLLTLASPVVSAFGAWVLLDESITFWQAIGAGIVLGALGAIALSTRVQAVREAALSDPPE